MAKIVLDIPKSKMRSFVKALVHLGIDGHDIQRLPSGKTQHPYGSLPLSLKKISTSFILFDWEFFSNELEYE